VRYISLFSGIEAVSVAAEPLGWEPVAFCEIDEFPSAVLAHRYPEVPNLGDITKVDWKKVVAEHGPVDVVVGGSPCQSFSVAGKREGLEGASGLMFEYIRAVSEILPRYWVWENVPGALSSSGGQTSSASSGRWLASGVLVASDTESDGEFWTRSSSEWPSAGAVSLLSESLESSKGLQRYSLSPKACSGILRRAEKRGKPLPPMLEAALRAQMAEGGAVAFAQNTRDEVRVQGDGTLSGALAAQAGMKQQTYVMASAHAHAEIGVGGGRSVADRPRAEAAASTSNGEDAFPALCATDVDKQFIDNQSVRGGRLVLDPRRECL